jgi:hypothetical protein
MLVYNHGGGGYLLNRKALHIFAAYNRYGLCHIHATTSMVCYYAFNGVEDR